MSSIITRIFCDNLIFLLIGFTVSQIDDIPIPLLNILIDAYKLQSYYDPEEVKICGILISF